MYQEFYNNTIQSNYIKYILQNTHIPTIPFTCNINHITKDCSYIHNNYFVKAKVSQDLTQVLSDIKNDPTKHGEYFITYEPYIFGKRYPGLTTNYVSNSDDYDPETHFYLGQYLKAYKAYYNIDLFPYYNCFSNEVIENIKLEKLDSAPFVSAKEVTSNTKYKVFSIPISLCQEYTIAIDCSEEVLMCPVFVDKNGVLKNQTQILQASLLVAPHDMVHKRSNYIQSRMYFNRPHYFFSPCIPGVYDKAQLTLPQFEKYLRLLIQVPATVDSSIVVLQGHYSNVKSYQDKIINLSINDVEQLLSGVKEKDYFRNTSHSFSAVQKHKLTYYGTPERIFELNPHLIFNPDGQSTDLISYKSSGITKPLVKLDWKKDIIDMNVNEHLIFPQETPCLSIQGKAYNLKSKFLVLSTKLAKTDYLVNKTLFSADTQFTFNINDCAVQPITTSLIFENSNTKDYLVVYANSWVDESYQKVTIKNLNENTKTFLESIGGTITKGSSRTQFICTFPIKFLNQTGTSTLDATSITIDNRSYDTVYWINENIPYVIVNDGDLVEVKAQAISTTGAYKAYESAWSTPVLYQAEVSRKIIPPNVTIDLVGKQIYWQQISGFDYYIKINESNLWESVEGSPYEFPERLSNLTKITLKASTQRDSIDPNDYMEQSIIFKQVSSSLNLKKYFNDSIIQIKSEYDLKLYVNNRSIDLNTKNDLGWTRPISIVSVESVILEVPLTDESLNFQITSNRCSASFNYLDAENSRASKLMMQNIMLDSAYINLDKSLADLENIRLIKTQESIFDLVFAFNADTTLNFKYIDWIEYLQDIDSINYTNKYLNDHLYTNLSLLYINDKVSYAFTNRLIEYLSNNVISHKDLFDKDIQTISEQLKISNSRYYNEIKTNSDWTNYKRIQAFELVNEYAQKSNLNQFKDINGFIDKDSEAALRKFKAEYGKQ